MGPGTGEYGQVSEWLERQQRRIAELEAENRELRRQLDELRRGAGIAVMIQGRAYSLAAPASAHTGEVPAMPSGPLYPQAHAPSQPTGVHPRARLTGAPARGRGAPIAASPQAAADAAAFPEEEWLTGPMRAVQAGTRRQPPRQAAPAARAQSPSESITPQWLRDEQQKAATREPATWDEIAAAQDDYASSAITDAHTYVRPRMKSRPLTPRLEPVPSVPFASLAQLTGQHPAARKPPANQQRQGARNPLKDSFLLG